jgi:aminoglycoside phosphotransferase family enzyme
MSRRPPDVRAPAAVALREWLRSRGLSIGDATAWITATGAVIALDGEHALKLQSEELSHDEQVQICEDEVGISMRLPEPHRAVVGMMWLDYDASILRADPAEQADPVILMRRLDPENVRDRLCRGADSGPSLANDFGRLLAVFHRNSPRIAGSADAGTAEQRELNLIAVNLEAHRGALGLSSEAARWVDATLATARAWLAAACDEFAARAVRGWQTEGHGDLHSDNLHLLGGIATLIDPLPLRRYRLHDVASDLGRLAFEFHRLAGADARAAALHAYRQVSMTSPSDRLIAYFEAKSLVLDVSVLAKYRVLRRPEAARGPHFLATLEPTARRIATLELR